MNITRRVTEAVDFEYMKAAIDAGNGPEFVRPFDELIIPLENGKSITAVCGGYVGDRRARFVLKDCLPEIHVMNKRPTNAGGYLNSEGRRHVLSGDTRPAQAQRRRLLRSVHRAARRGPPEPYTGIRERARPPLRVLYSYPGGRRGGRKMSARFHAKDGELVVLYECDPSKNTKCRKRNCKERGGPCSETTEPEMRVDGANPHYYTAESRGGKTVFIKRYIEEGKV